MKRFVWRLQRVLEIKKKEEQKVRAELFELTERLAQTRGELLARQKMLESIIEGLRRLRQMYRGQIFLEVFLLAGINDSEKEVEGLKGVIHILSPDKIQLNTVVRPPADQAALSLDMERLREIRDFFGEKAEIIAEAPLNKKWGQHESMVEGILEMAKRRPFRASDVANLFNMPLEEAEGFIKGLAVKGALRQQEHLGEVYYTLG